MATFFIKNSLSFKNLRMKVYMQLRLEQAENIFKLRESGTGIKPTTRLLIEIN
jgi:hypothetical protein